MLKKYTVDYLTSLELEGKAKLTIKAYTGILNKFADTYKDYENDVEKFYVTHTSSMTPSARRKVHVVLKGFGDWLLLHDRITKNPMLKIKAPKGGKKRPKPIPENKIDGVDGLIGQTPLKWRIAFKLTAVLGLRASETLSINLETLDLSPDHPSVLVIGKGNKERRMPLNSSRDYFAELVDYVNYIGRSKGPLFISERGNRDSYISFWRKWNEYIGSEYTLHQLRHTKATQMLHNGATLHEVQEFLGHSDPNTTTMYTMGGEAYEKRFREFV